MDYNKVYNAIILRAKSENRIKFHGVYYEQHHIIPKCIGGSNDKTNKVLLTAREHFICHKLLVYIYPHEHSLITALTMLMYINCNGHRKITYITSRDYAFLKERYVKVPITDEKRKFLSELRKGKTPWMKGKKHTEEAIRKNREHQLGKKQSGATINKRKKSMIGKNNREIIQLDLDGNFIREWHSTNEASRELGIGDTGIWKAMNGIRKNFGGFIWKYKK